MYHIKVKVFTLILVTLFTLFSNIKAISSVGCLSKEASSPQIILDGKNILLQVGLEKYQVFFYKNYFTKLKYSNEWKDPKSQIWVQQWKPICVDDGTLSKVQVLDKAKFNFNLRDNNFQLTYNGWGLYYREVKEPEDCWAKADLSSLGYLNVDLLSPFTQNLNPCISSYKEERIGSTYVGDGEVQPKYGGP